MGTTIVQPSKSIKDESFWQHHYQSQKSSGLSRMAYCRQQGLNYAGFSYWINKWNRRPVDKLVAVKLASDPVEKRLFCVLDLKSGHYLRIYDEQALAIILERYR